MLMRKARITRRLSVGNGPQVLKPLIVDEAQASPR